MPHFKEVDINEAALNSRDNRDFVPAARRLGMFEVLTPLQKRVLELSYLGDSSLTDAEIGQLLVPPRKPSAVDRIRHEAVWQLDHYDPNRVSKLLPLELSGRVERRLRGKFGWGVTPAELMAMSDEEILGKEPTRGFQKRSLIELRAKLAAYQLDNSL